ncbi:MAG: PD-(D/E)XK nuclease family protein, partial [Oscillospiraceae bacterium]|nr:PD-(D/E)XK nuclease family protein [Oscillospiraceae bacterium]
GVTSRDLELSLKAITSDGTKEDKKLSPEMPVVMKLRETNLLYANYEKLLENYIDKLDMTALAADHIASGKTKAFGGADVFVDCFNDFTFSQLELLKQVIMKAKNVTFGFTAALDSDCDVFGTANAHISRLKSAAEENGITVEFVTEGIESRYAEDCPLGEVARHLYQSMNNCEPLGDSCELVVAGGVYEELDYVAAKIKELTTDKGLRCNEIAVLCTDVGAYGRHVESAFKKYDIPFFLDTPEPILYQPLINLIISILNALENFNVDNVLSCVKSKFFGKPKTELDDEEYDDEEDKLTSLSDKDIDEFEKYVFEWDLKASHLKKPFTFTKNRGTKDFTQQTAELVRQSVAVPLLELQKKIRKSGSTINGAEMTELLYDFLMDKVGMRRVSFKRCRKKDNPGLDADRVDLYQRLWSSLIDIFNKLHDELSDTNVTIGDYGEIFREICAVTTLADPPQFIDCVLVGDIDRTRADNIKAAFVVGATYEAFPTSAFEAGIFSQYEIELIYDKIVHIDNEMEAEKVSEYIDNISKIADTGRREYCLSSVRDRYHLSLYRAYRAVTLPTEYLCISCPDIDAAGESTGRSDIFGELSSTFKDTKIINAASLGNSFYCRTPRAAKMRYAAGLNEKSDENGVLREALLREDEDFVRALDEIREMRSDVLFNVAVNGAKFSGKHSLKPETARLIFSDNVNTTAIEKLDACKFNYFCKFGLKIDERSKRSFTNNKRGDAIHYVFQNVLEEYSGDMNAFFALKRGELLSLSKKYLAAYRAAETNNDSDEDKRTEYLFNNIANSATDVLITMQAELFARRYRPKLFELDISENKDEPENNRHAIIDNEGAPTVEPPAAEIYAAAESVAKTPNEPFTPENAPYLIAKPLVIRLKDGSEVTVQGRIDRVDMFSESADAGEKPIAYIRVVDYKSSAHSFDLKAAQNGINIQMLLYLFALQNANEDNPTLTLRPGGVSYIPSKNGGAKEDDFAPYFLLAAEYQNSGLFIKDETTDKDLECYTNAILAKLESDNVTPQNKLTSFKKTLVPSGTNLAEAKYFNELRDDVLSKVAENLDAIFSGVIDALPVSYPTKDTKDPCRYCRFGDICQNAGKNVIKIEKAKLKPQKQKEGDTNIYWENKYITKNPDESKEKKTKKKEEEDDGGNG